MDLRVEFDDAAHGLAPDLYCYIPTVDDQAPTLEQLDEGVRFIKRVIDSGGTVYIHCGAGVGRAPTMAAAYLIATGMSLEGSLELIRKVRPFIYIMPPQMKQLEAFAANGIKREERP
jgi:protein-tyrosine phosphatase